MNVWIQRASNMSERLGLRVAIAAAEPRRGWVYYCLLEKSSEEGTIFSPVDYGSRFNMSRHRFQDITSALHFAPLKSAPELQKVR